jgi:mannose-1-phosphate guanylyltransferase
MVLCAGFGTRLLPLTTTTPKPLMPLWGVPNLTHILRTLHTWGVRDVLLNLHHVPEPIWQYARSEPVPGIKINVSYEPEILGTGGALQKAAWFFDDDPTWIVNADILMELDPRPIIRTMANPKTIATLWLRRNLSQCPPRP